MYRLIMLLSLLHISIKAKSFQLRLDTTKNLNIQLAPYIGLSKQKFNYNIAGNEKGTDPNILSELKWNKILAREIGGNLKVRYKRIIFKSTFIYSKTLSGSVSDIDYAEDNRRSIFSEQYFSNHKGSGRTINLMLGYNLVKKNSYLIDLLVAYEHVSNRLFLLNEKHLAETDPIYQPNLNSYYKYRHPNLGGVLNSNYSISRFINLSLELSAYGTFYYAYGNWNLRKDFNQPISYEHKGKGVKLSSSIAANIILTDCLGLGFGYSFAKQNLKSGQDVLFLTNGEALKTRLNQINDGKNTFFITLNHSIFNIKTKQ